MKVKISGIEKNSVVDGPGLRTVIFAQGCPHNCSGCHNPGTHDPQGGEWRKLDELVAEACREQGNGVTFSGGEPFLQAEAFAVLAARLKKNGLSIVTFSGYTYEELKSKAEYEPSVKELLDASDILIDGPFLLERRDPTLVFRGSANQRVIDMAKTRMCGEVVLSKLHFR